MDKIQRINWLKNRIDVHKDDQQFSGLVKHYKKELKELEDSIPKPIMHKVIEKFGSHVYLCNQACNTTKGKYTEIDEKVTCKNCLNILKNRNEDEI